MQEQEQEHDERRLELLDNTCSAGSLLARPRSPASISDIISVSLALVVELSAGPAAPSEADTIDKIDMRLEKFILMSSAVLWRLRGKSTVAFESVCNRNTGLLQAMEFVNQLFVFALFEQCH